MADRAAGSLPVANVQVLAEACNGGVDEQQQQVPERYLSKDPSSEEVVAGDDGACAIPVIDLRKLQDPQSSEEECAKLASACLNWGFFQVGTPSICFVISAYNTCFQNQTMERIRTCSSSTVDSQRK